MNNADKMFVKWSYFQSNIIESFRNLRQEEDLFDVTLVCNDGKQLEAHKLILSACSPLLRQMLSKSKHPHPFVFMPGMKSKELEAVLDFLYNGEVSVEQEDIADFLSLSQLLQIKGLTNHQENKSKEDKDTSLIYDKEDRHVVSEKKMKKEHPENQNNRCSKCGKYFITFSILKIHLMSHEGEESADDPLSERSASSENVLTNHDEIDNNFGEDETKSLSLHDMLRGIIECDDGVWKCKVCGKISKSQVHAKEHGEIHIDGLRYPCVECGKSLKTSCAMRQHMKRWHKAEN